MGDVVAVPGNHGGPFIISDPFRVAYFLLLASGIEPFERDARNDRHEHRGQDLHCPLGADTKRDVKSKHQVTENTLIVRIHERHRHPPAAGRAGE